MLKLTSRLSPEVYSPLCYVVASTDHTSADRIPKEGLRSGRCRVCTIPRSREVRRNHTQPENTWGAADTSTPWVSDSICSLANQSTWRTAFRANIFPTNRANQTTGLVRVARFDFFFCSCEDLAIPNIYSTARSFRKQVGQSYLSSVFTTLFAGLHAASMVVRVRPDLILVNGPGESPCVP